jgi:16S rRNA processing protein RimM
VAERICVAQIGGAHGLRGEVRLKSFTADPMAVRNYGLLTTEDGSATFEIEAVRPAKGHLIARFRGVGDRNTAERLVNVRLFVPRERLPMPAPDEFYHAGGTTVMVPFTAAFVPSVDIASRRIVVAPPKDAAEHRGTATE